MDQAERINKLARSWAAGDFTAYEGGVYSSEWFWAKALRVVETNPKVAARAVSVVEHTDWMPALLTGVKDFRRIVRGRGPAGHKAMWHAAWGGYPPADFLAALHPRLAELRKDLPAETFTTDAKVGTLCPEWAKRLGLKETTIVSAGIMDAQSGAVGGCVAPGTMLKIMGTSTCDLLIGPKAVGKEKLVKGICGQVDGSVIPGWIGYEAGQSAYGDIFAWFKSILAWPLKAIPELSGGKAAEDAIIPALEAAAMKVDPAESGLIALDWLNGRRTPFADQTLTGAIAGLTLGTDAPMIYRALVEAAAFGSRAIAERLLEEGVPIERIVAVGGVSRKSPLVMQISADVLGMEIGVSAADQSCALGAAMYAAVAAGIHTDVDAAQKAMGSGTEKVYKPDPQRKATYDVLYKKYLEFGALVEKNLKATI